MYYPYFRGKQFELILLRDNAEFLSKNNIHPIIEPVKSNFTALIRAMDVLNKKDVPCTLIVNPQAGQKPVPTENILNELLEDTFQDYNNISIGYILHAKSDLDELISLLQRYNASKFSIIHYGYTKGKEAASSIETYKNITDHIFIEKYTGKLYQKQFSKSNAKKILLRDGFKPQKKNANYPPDEHFSDLHITYLDEGVDGFGDFLIVGDEYTESGGPAYAVAIHLTYLDNDNDMFIYHFISNQNHSQTDPGGKFLEALFKLVEEVNKPDSLIYKSRACLEYLDLYKRKHFPGHGSVKKLSMQHHVELIAEFMKQEK